MKCFDRFKSLENSFKGLKFKFDGPFGEKTAYFNTFLTSTADKIIQEFVNYKKPDRKQRLAFALKNKPTTDRI
jgi:hypothetical protein